MKITQSNLHYIVFLLRKCLPETIATQYFYNMAKKQNAVLKYFNIPNKFGDFLYDIEESNYGEMEGIKIDLESYYIRIRNYNWEEAFCIYVGDEISFKTGSIHIRCKHPTNKSKCNHIIYYQRTR